MSEAALLQRRLAALRVARAALPTGPPPAPVASAASTLRAGAGRAERLAAAVGGESLDGPGGHVVRVEPATIALPLVRTRLASLPGQPPAEARLVCLDTETTGLGTAAGTLAFLVGLGWWEGDRFRQVQLLCPDHSDEPALLAALDAAIPSDAWLVTYNGRGFDWPLLVTRYRLARRAAPEHAGMLDLLPHVRRLFRHRLGDARLSTVERELLGVRRDRRRRGLGDPRLYLAFVRGGQRRPARARSWTTTRRTSGRSDGSSSTWTSAMRTRIGAAGSIGRPGRARPRLHTRAAPRRGAWLPRRGGRRLELTRAGVRRMAVTRRRPDRHGLTGANSRRARPHAPTPRAPGRGGGCVGGACRRRRSRVRPSLGRGREAPRARPRGPCRGARRRPPRSEPRERARSLGPADPALVPALAHRRRRLGDLLRRSLARDATRTAAR